MSLSLIAAIARDGSIGQAGGLPWPRLQHAMDWFRRLTMSLDPLDVARQIIINSAHPGAFNGFSGLDGGTNAVLMGRKTWDGLKHQPLKHRQNIVLHRSGLFRAEEGEYAVWREGDENCPVDTYCAHSFPQALHTAHLLEALNTFVIGGASVYAEALQLPELRTMFIAEINAAFPGADTWFPGATKDWLSGGMLCPEFPVCYERTLAGPWQEEHGLRFRLTVWSQTGQEG